MPTYSVYAPIYFEFTIEADNDEEAYEIARETLTRDEIIDRINGGDFDIDCDPMVDRIDD